MNKRAPTWARLHEVAALLSLTSEDFAAESIRGRLTPRALGRGGAGYPVYHVAIVRRWARRKGLLK
ncbi:MAG: hypothetical protein FD180_4343 [Planctomycetota bacterium]|nr:MAG: hypothetical protein FD180_4343 [Planctomycetota bacterium]